MLPEFYSTLTLKWAPSKDFFFPFHPPQGHYLGVNGTEGHFEQVSDRKRYV